MKFEEDETHYIQENRLISTIITGKPHTQSLWVALLTIFVISLVTTQVYWNDIFGLADKLPAINKKIFSNYEWWRPFTAIFIHADAKHLLSNMYMLGIFSFFVYGYFGFTVYPIISYFIAGIVNVLAVFTYPADVRLLGASGLVYVLGGFWLCMYFLIQRQYRVFNRLLRVFGIALIIFFPSTFSPTTSYRTHAIGFIFGILMGTIYFYKKCNLIRAHEVYRTSSIEVEPTSH